MGKIIIWNGMDINHHFRWHECARSFHIIFYRLLNEGVVHREDIESFLVRCRKLNEFDYGNCNDDDEIQERCVLVAEAENYMTDFEWKRCLHSSFENAYFQDSIVLDEDGEYTYKGFAFKGYQLADKIIHYGDCYNVGVPSVMIAELKKYIENDVANKIDELAADSENWIARAINYLLFEERTMKEDDISALLQKGQVNSPKYGHYIDNITCYDFDYRLDDKSWDYVEEDYLEKRSDINEISM